MVRTNSSQKKAYERWRKKVKMFTIRYSPQKDALIKECAKLNNETVNAMLNRLIDEEINRLCLNSNQDSN